MSHKNFEFKAHVNDLAGYESKLRTLNPEFKGIDNQIDTYFNVKQGRLKLREGNIENALIHYEREDIAGSKLSKIVLFKHNPDPALKQILNLHFGIKITVEKERKIYFIGNVKFHFDTVRSLGYFIEVEAIDLNDEYSVEQLQEQCDFYFRFFGLNTDQLIDKSYSDMLMADSV